MTSATGKIKGCNPTDKAFSLLEVVIAIAILSLGIVTVLQAFSFATRAAGLAFDIINAVFLAEDKMQELEFKRKQNLINQDSLQAEDKKGKFEYKYVLNLQPDLNLYRLDLDINWQWADKEERLNLNTYLR